MENTHKSSDNDDYYSTDDEKVVRDFDKEVQLIINSETLPKKSSDRYLQVYELYKKWLNENKNHLSSCHEKNIIIYFNSLKEKLKPSTLWSIWTMLKKTLNAKEQIDVNKFLNLKAILNSNSKYCKPVKSLILKWQEIERFIKEADNHVYLALKVILIFGISGALRCDEIVNLNVQDVEELSDNRYLISIQSTKNDYNSSTISASRQLLIGPLFYNYVKKYISLRPTRYFTDRFFIRYQQGKCLHQVIGINKIYEIPQIIATYLGLKEPKRYTGHCYRRTGTTLLVDLGADFSKVKQLGGWVSDKVCHGYIESSIYNRQQIFDGVTPAAKTNTATTNNYELSEPSTSKATATEIINIKENVPTVQLNWKDFSTDLTVDDLDSVSDSKFDQSLALKPIFKNAKNKPIKDYKNKLATNSTKSKSDASFAFTSKPPIKLTFNNNSNEPPIKKLKINSMNVVNKNDRREKVITEDKQNNSDSKNLFKNSYIKYENCTFHSSITNNFYSCENYKK